jgi:hypothetical protein
MIKIAYRIRQWWKLRAYRTHYLQWYIPVKIYLKFGCQDGSVARIKGLRGLIFRLLKIETLVYVYQGSYLKGVKSRWKFVRNKKKSSGCREIPLDVDVVYDKELLKKAEAFLPMKEFSEIRE